MKPSVRSAFLSCLTLAGLLTLSACGKSGQPANGQAPAKAGSAAPAAAASAPAATPAPAGTAGAPAGTAPAAPASAAKPAASGTTAAAPQPAAADNAVKVTTLTVGDAVDAGHKVRKAVGRFAPNQKTLYASVDTRGNTDGATLNATWRYLEGKGQLVSSISQSIATSGPATTTFKVENPDLWPEGKYKVVISLDGKQVASQDFEVKKR